MNTAHIYLRVSTGKQAASGLGIEGQEAACREWCEREGLLIGGVYADEGISGGKPMDERPGLMDAVGAVGTGDVLVVYDRSRLGRDQIECAIADRLVEQQGGRTASANGVANDDGPTGQLLRTILDAVSQWERANSAIKTRMAMRAKAARGEYCGGRAPLGYSVTPDGKLEPDPDEAAALAFMRELAATGLGPRPVAREMTEAGYKTRTGKPWHSETVRRRCADLYARVSVRPVRIGNGEWWLVECKFKQSSRQWSRTGKKTAGPFRNQGQAMLDAESRGWVLR